MNREEAEMKKLINLLTAVLLFAGVSVARAQDEMTDQQMHDMGSMSAETMPDGQDMNMNHEMDHAAMQSQNSKSGLRDPNAYADGYGFGTAPRPRLSDEKSMGSVLINRLESQRDSNDTSTAYDMRAWYGRDYQRLLLKAEGNINAGELEESNTSLYWSQAVASFWDAHLGLRHDSGIAPDRDWFSVGVEGLAPYWFDLDATLNIGDKGRILLSLEAEYELLLTQRVILQPRLAVDLRHKEDAESGLGPGVTEIVAGMRLRYEVRREFAPYLGIEWTGSYGATAEYIRNAGNEPIQARAVAGLRLWF
jgi:copper resistance protein B